MNDKVTKYVNAIRNEEKRRCAIAYYRFLFGTKRDFDPSEFKLKPMTVQAVRMRIRELM